jgi:hypothetical protein
MLRGDTVRPVTKQEYVNRQVSETSYFNDPTKEWLMSFPSIETVRSACRRFFIFCEWLGKDDLGLIREYREAQNKNDWAKETGRIIIRYMLEMEKAKKWSNNTARSSVSSVMGFFTYHCQKVQLRRGTMLRQERAKGKHRFTQKELQKMYYCSDLKEKAILATAVCLGYASQARKECRTR